MSMTNHNMKYEEIGDNELYLNILNILFIINKSYFELSQFFI